jgi:hypothetical protein
MAIFLNNKVGFKIATINLSDHVTAFSLNRQLDSVEVTAMGDTAHKYVAGLAADSITVSFLNDTASASVLPTLQAAFGTTVAWQAIQDSSAAVSATNLLYSGTIFIDNLTDITGDVASEGMLDLTFQCNSKSTTASTGTWA